MDIRTEIKFWTRIMKEHGEFIYASLAPNETEAINNASYYINLFNNLYAEAISNQLDTCSLISNCKAAVMLFIDFNKRLLANLMTCNIQLNMTPSFLNHMINEAIEFLYFLNLADGTTQYDNFLEILRIHVVWLPDASGHASAVAAELDAIESQLVKEANMFSKKFDQLFKKAFEMYSMYEKTGLQNGAIHYFNEEVKLALTEFIEFLEKIEELRESCSIFSFGTFSPAIPNHMMLEEGYYYYKIDEIGERFG